MTTNEDGDGDFDNGAAMEEEPSVIVQLSNRVQDGTRCRIGSLDMCIQGICQVCMSWLFLGELHHFGWNSKHEFSFQR